MLISQIRGDDDRTEVVVREGTEAYIVNNAGSLYALAMEAADQGAKLVDIISRHGLGAAVDLESAYSENRILAPISHSDTAHLYVTGCGLTHPGAVTISDAGQTGVQPDWFFRGNGTTVVGAGTALELPAFANDGSEQPEIAGIYIIDKTATPRRIGFALANGFSDHVLARQSAVCLAHSKLRQTAVGPEIMIGALPRSITGNARILRNGAPIRERAFLAGEDNMSVAIENLEVDHFKHAQFRQPGDVHIHLFGTVTLSFADGVKTTADDIFEIEAAAFGLSLRNPMRRTDAVPFAVKAI
ncbi:MAG: GguC protein [Rhodospirillales bacterium]|nr:GguC protein [Rhodospirillales bacterium]